MLRRGECNNCGWCCQFEGIHRNVAAPSAGGALLHPDDRRFYELRGGTSPDGGKTVRYLVHAFAPCSNHDKDGKRCKDYAGRPTTCVDFPSVPAQIEGTPCSHWFEMEVDGAIERRGGAGSPYPTAAVFG